MTEVDMNFGKDLSTFGPVTNEKQKIFGGNFVEHLWKADRVSENLKPLKEYVMSVADTHQEALTLANNSAMTTTMIANFIEEDYKPVLIATNSIKLAVMPMKGNTALKITKGVNLTASSVSNGAVSADDQDYGSITITPSWYGVRTTIEHELLQQGLFDVIADKFREMGAAIGKSFDSLIVTEVEKASHKNDTTYDASGTNANYVFSGSTTDISYANLLTAWGKLLGMDATPDTVLVNPTNFALIMNDTQIKSMMKMGDVPAGSVVEMLMSFLNMKIVCSSQITANRTFLIDSSKLGYAIDASPIMSFDGRLVGTVNYEAISVKAYGVGIVRYKAIVSIADNTVDPSTGTN